MTSMFALSEETLEHLASGIETVCIHLRTGDVPLAQDYAAELIGDIHRFLPKRPITKIHESQYPYLTGMFCEIDGAMSAGLILNAAAEKTEILFLTNRPTSLRFDSDKVFPLFHIDYAFPHDGLRVTDSQLADYSEHTKAGRMKPGKAIGQFEAQYLKDKKKRDAEREKIASAKRVADAIRESATQFREYQDGGIIKDNAETPAAAPGDEVQGVAAVPEDGGLELQDNPEPQPVTETKAAPEEPVELPEPEQPIAEPIREKPGNAWPISEEEFRKLPNHSKCFVLDEEGFYTEAYRTRKNRWQLTVDGEKEAKTVPDIEAWECLEDTAASGTVYCERIGK